MGAGERSVTRILWGVLDQFSTWPKGGALWPEGGVVAHASQDEWDSWADALERVGASAMTDRAELFLGHALDLAEERMSVHPDEYDDEDRAALEALRRMVAERNA